MSSTFAPSLSILSPISPLSCKSPPAFRVPSLFPKPLSLPSPLTLTSAKTKPIEPVAASYVDEDEDDDDFEDEEEEDEFLAFEDMRKWELNKPAGFGKGKVYDTSVEEKLLEEIEKDRAAQAAAAAKKVNSSLVAQRPQQESGVIPSGHSVRLGNLPKKKNIHRDLQIAFKGFAGIVNINPAVTGNQKTRDPVCKGFAFVEFESKEAAVGFVTTYSNKDIVFGKVQKKITCEIINPRQLVNGSQSLSRPNITDARDYILQKDFICKSVVDSNREPVQLTHGQNTMLPDSEEREMGTEYLNISSSSDNESNRQVNALGSNNLASSIQKQRKQTTKKLVKKKSAKNAKLSLPASVARLKIKERTVLSGVFSKYGAKTASASD